MKHGTMDCNGYSRDQNGVVVVVDWMKKNYKINKQSGDVLHLFMRLRTSMSLTEGTATTSVNSRDNCYYRNSMSTLSGAM